MTQKEHPGAERGAGILIKESSMKMIDTSWGSGKALNCNVFFLIYFTISFNSRDLHFEQRNSKDCAYFLLWSVLLGQTIDDKIIAVLTFWMGTITWLYKTLEVPGFIGQNLW